MKKERNAPKERKTRTAEFFCRKIPVFAPHPSPPQLGEGVSIFTPVIPGFDPESINVGFLLNE